MGVYINPKDRSKEQWLAEHGTVLTNINFRTYSELRTENALIVGLVDNGMFTAAAVAFNERELEVFALSGDSRPKKWFSVPIADLLQVAPELADYMAKDRK